MPGEGDDVDRWVQMAVPNLTVDVFIAVAANIVNISGPSGGCAIHIWRTAAATTADNCFDCSSAGHRCHPRRVQHVLELAADLRKLVSQNFLSYFHHFFMKSELVNKLFQEENNYRVEMSILFLL